MAQVVSTWGTRIRGVFRHSIAKASSGFFERGAANLATDYDEQTRVPHVLKNMGHPASQPTDGLHTSAPLQNRSSLHAALFGVLSHESVASLPESVVQATESLQSTGVPAWR